MSDQELENPEALNMNCEEGHLGGYIRSGSKVTPSGLMVVNGDPFTYFPDLWRWTYDCLNIRSVLDVGCGEGHCAAFYQMLGCEVLGIDGSKQASRDSVIPDRHVVHDYVEGPYRPDREFDLVWSCEFVEHVEECHKDNFLETFSAASRYLMMTFAAPGQPGWHHVNCQTEEYWIDCLENRGFRFEPGLTFVSRYVAKTGHYAGRGLVFAKSD